jgi:hypothetical protein
MTIGDLDILAKMSKTGNPFSAQEDIGLVVHFHNKGAKDITVPYLPEHPITYQLKELSTGKETRITDEAKPNPGTARPKSPTALIKSGKDGEWTLHLNRTIGFFPKGEYSVRIKVESAALSFETDWRNFEVEGMHVVNPGASFTPEADPELLHYAWRDDGGKPPRILFRTTDIGGHEEWIFQTISIGDADETSAPVPSSAVPGLIPDVTWLGWTMANQLNLTSVYGLQTRTFLHPMPDQNKWELSHPLVYSEKTDPSKSGSKSKRLLGSLIASDSTGGIIQPFQSLDSSFAWLPPFKLQHGEVLASSVVAFSDSKRFIFTIRQSGPKLFLEALTWEDNMPLGPLIPLGSFPASPKSMISFDAIVQDSGIKWGLLQIFPGASANANTLRCWTHLLNAVENRQGPAVPKVFDWNAMPGPIQFGLKFDPKGSPWLLHRDAHGAWLQSPEWLEPVKVETPRGSKFEMVYFPHGSGPKVSYLDPDLGFKTMPVVLPQIENR